MLVSGQEKKLWRCNQWWNKRCRARVFTIGGTVTPLNKYHTHQEIIKRKKREARKPQAKGDAQQPADAAKAIKEGPQMKLNSSK